MCGWRILTTLICIPFPHVRSALICLYDNSLGLLSPVSSCPALDAPPPLSAAPAALLAPPVASAVSFSTSWANDRDHQATLLVRKWWSWLSSDYKNGSGIVLGIMFFCFFLDMLFRPFSLKLQHVGAGSCHFNILAFEPLIFHGICNILVLKLFMLDGICD